MPPRHHYRPRALIRGINPLAKLIMVITGPNDAMDQERAVYKICDALNKV